MRPKSKNGIVTDLVVVVSRTTLEDCPWGIGGGAAWGSWAFQWESVTPGECL